MLENPEKLSVLTMKIKKEAAQPLIRLQLKLLFRSCDSVFKERAEKYFCSKV